MGIFGGGFVGGRGVFQRNAKLVFALAGGDLGVGLGIHVGIDADGDRGLAAQLAGHVVDAGQLGFAFDMKAKNARFQGELDLRLGSLPTPAKTLRLAPGARRQHAPKFAAATRSKAAPRLEKCRRTARFELAFIA